MSTPLLERWPAVEFSADVKALARARHQATPGGGGPPLCPACGFPILFDIDYHHRKKQRRGGWAGDGRPSNCLPVHGRIEAGQCHFKLIHDDVTTAKAKGLIILMSAPLAAYRMPLLLAHRAPGIDPDYPWVVLDDDGGMRQATPAEVAGDYA
jgi:hypothetical protein